ncbi:MAG: UDP-N-acetylglucosamine 2-epimerase (non-hydrolyzing) [Candidatus Aminicenantes bacterium]|nr:UDP-N-acetylglucosamine 2-epimerase (non-hydrolyzing) [Candidatus Aminicenantes bacterium]
MIQRERVVAHRLLVAFGTRPEIIKLAPVIKELKKYPQDFELVLLATAQHRGLLDQMLQLFEIEPEIDLNLMEPNQSLDRLTSRVMLKASQVLRAIKPAMVIVQGDTTTAMVVALAAFYLKIPVAHVEAGLRTRDRYQPFPEEINRRLISTIASLHFAPTRQAVLNLKKEGIPIKNIFLTGNTVVDALLQMKTKIATIPPRIKISPQNKLILVTAHRRENFGEPLKNVCQALLQLVEDFPEIEIVYPVHPNPNVSQLVYSLLSGRPRVHLLRPLPYIDLLTLIQRAYLILTDSGGIQEEAPSFHKPVLVLREVTERPEGIKAGVARLVGTNTQRIVTEVARLLRHSLAYERMTKAPNPYGDGRASRRIVHHLRRYLACLP